MLGFLVLAWVAAMSIPAVLAFREKRRRELAGAPPFDETSDEIDLAAIFEELDARSTASAFRGGHLLVWYGGGRLDLRAATLDPNGASLDVRSLFGGLQIVVPPSWPVEVHPLVFAGGVGDARDASLADPSKPTLVLDVMAAFGGVSIVGREAAEASTDVAIPIRVEPSAIAGS
jgi:hypothetical protein